MPFSSDEHSGLILLGDYTAPDEPTVDMVQRLWQRARRLLPVDVESQVAGKQRLRRTSAEQVANLTDHPDCANLSVELDQQSEAWLAEGATSGIPLVVVTSPCDSSRTLETWARSRGHAVLSSPARSRLPILEGEPVSGLTTPAEGGSADGLLVVPRLEDWFLRHRHGLTTVRALLVALSSRRGRPFLIGCNSWAWRYLERIAGADMLFPKPLTFRPFNADRLADWFADIAGQEAPQKTTFRDSSSGLDVFARNDEGELQADFLQYIAARSRGVPWIAWALWRQSLRTLREAESGSADRSDAEDGNASRVAADDESTIWLIKPEECELPKAHERRSRLVLHALLLHGSLTAEELARVLPISNDTVLVPALVGAGLVEESSGQYRCAPSAYATVFESLATAGFSTPVI